MRKSIISCLLAATLALSSVPALAADEAGLSQSGSAVVSGNAVEEEKIEETKETKESSGDIESALSKPLAFDEALAALFDNSMSITDDQIFAVANVMQSDFSKVDRTFGADAADIKGLVKSFESAKANYLLGQGAVPFEGNVKDEWDRQDQLLKFGFSDADTITKLLPRVRVDSVSTDGANAAISLYEWMTEGYVSNGSTAVNASGVAYRFTLNLNKKDDVWTVGSVSNTDQNYRDLEADGIVISPDGTDVIPAEEGSDEGEEFEEAVPVGASYNYADPSTISWTYDPAKAIKYADAHVFQYNPDYKSYKGENADCANFVSQSLYSAGFPMTALWNPQLYTTREDYYAWVANDTLRDYLEELGAGKVILNPSSSDIRPGDPIWYNWQGDRSRTDHVTICVGKNSQGKPIIDAHTNDRYHHPWDYGPSQSTRMSMQMYRSGRSQIKPPAWSVEPEEYRGRAVYRMYNPNSGEHFYTKSWNEVQALVKAGWNYEGIGWVSSPVKNSHPVYRMYNPNAGDHHYTLSASERDHLAKVGWNYEGISAYASDSKAHCLYRLYNPNAKAGAHHYTSSAGERDHLVKVGWRYEGISWYSDGQA